MTTRALFILSTGLAMSPSALAQTYSLTALPTTPGTHSQGFGLNDAGDVCGQARFGASHRTSLWFPGLAPQAVGTQNGYGNDMNNAGQIFGSYYGTAGAIPFVWENNVATLLPLVPGFSYADNWQINDSGVGPGTAYNAGTNRGLGAACTWTKTGGQWVLSVLPALSSPSTGGGAFGINEAGVVVGTSRDPTGTLRACKWEGGVISELAAPVPNSFSMATSINSAGEYVGSHDHGSPVTSSAFHFDGMSANPLAGLAGYNHAIAYRISDAGAIIGWSYNGDPELFFLSALDCAATVWRGGVPFNVNHLIHSAPAPGYDIRQLWDINSSGQIAAYACLNGTGAACTGGNWRAVLLTPCNANCDGSTTAPVLNVSDFICFQTKYAQNDPYANCDGSTTAPVLNVSDFICFQTNYATGCS